jgi:hypothetical protein
MRCPVYRRIQQNTSCKRMTWSWTTTIFQLIISEHDPPVQFQKYRVTSRESFLRALGKPLSLLMLPHRS